MYMHRWCNSCRVVALLAVLVIVGRASAFDVPVDLSLDGVKTASAVTALTAQSESTAVTTRSSSRHPEWVLDAEAAMWPGFLTGLSGYEDFVMPVGQFAYFEDPFITTDIRLMYVYHTIPNRSVLRGGQVNFLAVAARVALTERLAFIATKDGYSWVDSGITRSGDGWNDIAGGFKYALIVKPDEQFLLTVGLRWELANGSSDAWQGGDSQEFSPFVSFAKGWDKWHFLGAVSGRIPTDSDSANASVVWNMHLDYKLTETFRPLIELHGIHWLSNADKLPLSADYLDVGSLGASKARGRDFFSAGLGFRWQAMDNVNVGLTWEFPLESAASGLQQNRFTFNTVVSF
jgi:hypothetical protein